MLKLNLWCTKTTTNRMITEEIVAASRTLKAFILNIKRNTKCNSNPKMKIKAIAIANI